jgi:hypothetical protein
LVYIFPFWYVVARKIWQPCGSSLQVLFSKEKKMPARARAVRDIENFLVFARATG